MLTVVMRTIWPLFLGILFIGLGNGLQGTLSSWRADYEGFSVLTTGLVMSGYFVGAFVSSMISPRQINNTFSILSYAAYASIASTAILMLILFIEPPAVSYTHLRAHETQAHLVCRLLLAKNNN